MRPQNAHGLALMKTPVTVAQRASVLMVLLKKTWAVDLLAILRSDQSGEWRLWQ